MLKKIFLSFLLFILMVPAVFADEASFGTSNDGSLDGKKDFRSPLFQIESGLSEQSQAIDDTAEPLELPSFEDPMEDGSASIMRALRMATSLLKLVLAPVAVLVIAVMALRMVTAGKDNSSVAEESKKFMEYGVEGLLVVFIADQVVNVFFGPEGDVFRLGTEGARAYGSQLMRWFDGIYMFMQVMISSVSLFVLVMNGFRYIVGSYSDDEVGKAKTHITWALIGLFIVAISEFVVKKILFKNEGTSLGVADAKLLFAQLTNFMAGTIGTLSFVVLIYGGYLYVSSGVSEDQTENAKNYMKSALIGIVIALSAYGLVTTIVTLTSAPAS